MADGDSNMLIAVAIVLLIVVIMYGSGCGRGHHHAGTMVVQDKAVVTGDAAVAVAPVVTTSATTASASPAATSIAAASGAAPVGATSTEYFTLTTTPNPVKSILSKMEYAYDPNKRAAVRQVERLSVAGARNVISKGVGNARSLYKDITVKPKTTQDFLKNDQDVAKLFRNVERCCGERLTPNPAAEAAFQYTEKAVDPSYYTGMRKRGGRKNYKKEGFVDSNGRWQSFMYWKVGCDGDPRPKSLGDSVDSASRLPHVAIPESDANASLRAAKDQMRKERLTQRQKLNQLRGMVNDQGLIVRV